MKKGFTLVELLVSIAIVGIMASLSVQSYNEYVQRAYAAATIQDLRNIETALRAYHDSIEATTWLWETSIPGGSIDARITHLSAVKTAVGKFLPKAPAPQFTGSTYYVYDNDNWDADGYNPATCAATYDGVGVTVEGPVSNIAFNQIEKALDGDNNPLCGKVRRATVGGTLYYMIGRNYRDL